jgi:hypothetical protein
MAAGLEKLLDFSQPLDVPLLDEVWTLPAPPRPSCAWRGALRCLEEKQPCHLLP